MRSKNCILLYLILLTVGTVVSEPTKQSTNSSQRHLRPIIFNCHEKFTIPENLGAGTTVGQVIAGDYSGEISYSVLEINSEIRFKIDKRTGMITSKETFDRDEPSNQKKFFMTVDVQDDSNPQMHTYCRVEINILDVNDNFPVFVKKIYSGTVRQNATMGDNIMQISAVDIDDGKNSIVTYNITSISSSHADDLENFGIETETGRLFLLRNIKKSAGYIFRLLAVATDKGVSPLTNFIPIEILVIEPNSKHPSFNMQSPISMNLAEDFNYLEMSAFNFEVTSNIEDDPFVSCELITGTIEQTNKKNIFMLRMLSKNKGSIKVFKPLDYERIKRYVLILRAVNRDNLTSELEIFVNIEDVNDNPPVIQHFLPVTIEEGIDAGYPIVNIYATDADGTIENARIQYLLANYDDLFSVNRSTGLLTTSRRIGRNESQLSWIKVKVIVQDVSRSIVYKNSKQNLNKYIYQINVTPM